jgi:oxalate decarboxylase/phosphoglucose isomerase-like protein (cupin superfamily)
VGNTQQGPEPGRRPGDMRFVGQDDVETQVFDWGTLKWLAEPRVCNAQRFSQGVVILLPGKGHTRHNHPGVEETLYVVSGRGRQMVEDPEGKPVYRDVAAGDMVHIPISVFHETINTGWEPLKIIATYAPHGPEAALRAMDEVQVLPPGTLPG